MPGEQRLAQRPMAPGEIRFDPDGLAVVVDGFLQSGLILRGNAERVPGRGPRGVTVLGLPVISHRLVQGWTTELVEGFHALRVIVVRLFKPALGDQGDTEQVVGPGTIGVAPQGLPVVVDRLVQGPRTGLDFAEVAMGGGQLGIDPQGVLVREHRQGPIALAFQGHAEVVQARGEPGIVLHQPVQGGSGVPYPVLVNLDEADVVQNGGRLRADFQSLLVIGQGRRGITPRVPFRAVQRQGQRKVRPEVVGILLPDAPEKADPVLTGRGQPFAQRQQQR